MKNVVQIFILLPLLLVLPVMSQSWDVPTMPVEDIQPGMRGTARSVFHGDTIEEFGVEIIEVMHNFYPHRDVILARLLGERTEKTGVVSGMSGSPVYIDGKLIGALAYRFGQFMKEPIAGIMPIAAMLEITDKEHMREIETSQRVLPFSDYWNAALVGTDELFWERILQPLAASSASTALANMQPISKPLVFSGFQPEIVQPYQSLFQSMGFSPMISGAAGSAADAEPTTFEPGSAVSIIFVSGDYSIEATGTVTSVVDDQLLAFGHQLFNFGSIQLPLGGTKVYATLPSLMGSSKMSTSTEIMGVFRQDRMSGALGDLSIMPQMIPVKLQMQSPEGTQTEFNFKMANDPAFNNLLPFYLRMALIQAMYSSRLAGEQNSSQFTGSINLADGRSVRIDDFFTSRQQFGFLAAGSDAVSASDLVTVMLGSLLVNDFDGPEITDIDLNLETVPGRNHAMIESVWLDKTQVKPGETVTVTMNLRDNNERLFKLHRTLTLPKSLGSSRLALIVSNGSSLTQYEMQANRSKFVPKEFDDIVRLLNERRNSKHVYIQLRAYDAGLVVEGEELPDLPPSVLSAMNTRSSKGESRTVRDRVLEEVAVETGNVILGAQRLLLSVKQPTPATTPDGNGKQTWFY